MAPTALRGLVLAHRALACGHSDFTKTGTTYSWEDYVYHEGQLLAARHSDGRLVHFDVDHLGSVRQ